MNTEEKLLNENKASEILQSKLYPINKLDHEKLKRPNGFDDEIVYTVDEWNSDSLQEIVYSGRKTGSFYSPIVVATSEKTSSGYTICYNCFFALNLTEEKVEYCKNYTLKFFKVYFKNEWIGTDFVPEFLIDFDIEENPSKPIFKTFVIRFCIDVPVLPTYITTFLWNEDPIGSRGTVTTVQPPVLTTPPPTD